MSNCDHGYAGQWPSGGGGNGSFGSNCYSYTPYYPFMTTYYWDLVFTPGGTAYRINRLTGEVWVQRFSTSSWEKIEEEKLKEMEPTGK